MGTVRKPSAYSIGSTNSAPLFLTLPTSLLAFHAFISSASNGRG